MVLDRKVPQKKARHVCDAQPFAASRTAVDETSSAALARGRTTRRRVALIERHDAARAPLARRYANRGEPLDDLGRSAASA